MNQDPDSDSLSKGKGKGKARAMEEPCERTPLLPTPSSSVLDDDTRSPSPVTARRRLLSKLLSVFFVTLCVCVIFLVGFALIAWSYASHVSRISPETVLNEAMVFKGPERVDVLNVTGSGGIWTRVEGRIGLDAGRAVGVNSESEDTLLTELWKSFGRWGIRKMDVVGVHLSRIRLVSDDGVLLATVDVPPQEVMLTVDPPYDLSWLQAVSTTIYVQPSSNTSDIIDFLSEAWRAGHAIVNIEVGKVDIDGGFLHESSWRKRVHSDFSNIATYLVLKVPQLPGLPPPGRGIPFPPLADLITLETFSVSNLGDQLALSAIATIVDPAPISFNFTAPPLPFAVSLPPDVPIAAVTTAAFTTTHPNISISITGSVLPLPPASSSKLSSFLSRYLSAQPNDIVLSTPLIPNLNIDAAFPAPHPRPRVLRNVTIQDMKLKPGNVFMASGVVFARVVLPRGLNISIDVTHVLPDVLVFDGEVPDTYPLTLLPDTYPVGLLPPPPSPPLPDPLPERAFAHILPDDWLVSESVRVPVEEDGGGDPGEDGVPLDPEENGGGGGAVYTLTARLEDVPLEVLPGRDGEFSSFVRKVVFGKDGAVAGLVGTVAVEVDVPGLPVAVEVDVPGLPGSGKGSGRGGGGGSGGGELVLEGLPFRGSVRIGKKNMFGVGM